MLVSYYTPVEKKKKPLSLCSCPGVTQRVCLNWELRRLGLLLQTPWTTIMWCVILKETCESGWCPFLQNGRGDLFLTVIYLLMHTISGQLLSFKGIHLHRLWLCSQKVTTVKSACNHVSSLKSARSGLRLFYEVLGLSLIFLLLSDWVYVGLPCRTIHIFIFVTLQGHLGNCWLRLD